jgi:hypothetical protein
MGSGGATRLGRGSRHGGRGSNLLKAARAGRCRQSTAQMSMCLQVARRPLAAQAVRHYPDGARPGSPSILVDAAGLVDEARTG